MTKIYTDSKLIFADTTYKIRGAIFAVYNTLGPGHKEIVYQKALEKEFEEQKILFVREQSLDVKYRNFKVGKYIPDFIIDNKVIVELKAVEFMPKAYENQIIHYLKTTGFQIGLLVNFGQPKIFIKRLIWSKNQ